MTFYFQCFTLVCVVLALLWSVSTGERVVIYCNIVAVFLAILSFFFLRASYV